MASSALAQLSPATNPLPGSPITLQTSIDVVGEIANFVIVAGVTIAVIFIIWGGIRYMAARGNDTEAANARKMILNGLIGAMVVLGVGVLLSTVEYIRDFFTSGTP